MEHGGDPGLTASAAAAPGHEALGVPPNPLMAQVQLTDIATPHPHDVLCGRGGATNNHLGNSHWRMLVSTNKELYVSLPKRQKQLLSRSIVHAVRSQNPPGRFLQRDPQSDLWFDVGDARATEKTSQALREGAPKLRDKLKKTSSNNATDEAAPPPPAEASSKKKQPPEAPPIIVHPPPGRTKEPSAAPVYHPQPLQHHHHHHHDHQQQQQHEQHTLPHHAMPPPEAYPHGVGGPPPLPPPSVLDPVGEFSFGSVPDAPDLGLQQGYSFGSVMSVDPQPHHRAGERHSFSSNTTIPPPRLPEGTDHSFGSLILTDAEQRQIAGEYAMPPPAQGVGTGVASYASPHPPPPPPPQASYNHHPVGAVDPHDPTHPPPPPVDFGLEHAGLSAGSVMSYGTIQVLAGLDTTTPLEEEDGGAVAGQQQLTHGHKAQMVSFGGRRVVPSPAATGDPQEKAEAETLVPPPVDYGLEPGGFSAGSMMSIGTIKLEDTGTSFGSVMSFATTGDAPPRGGTMIPGAVDGGLDDIGTSFGSMSLVGGATTDGPAVAATGASLPHGHHPNFHPPPPLDAAEPTLLHQQRSRGNLLDCDDSDSEDEQRSAQSSIQKSADWEKLKATFEAQMKSGQTSSTMPPSLYGGGGGSSHYSPPPPPDTVLPVAVAPSAVTDEHESHMPPPAARKEGHVTADEEAWRNYEATLLKRGNSLAEEQFHLPPPPEKKS